MTYAFPSEARKEAKSILKLGTSDCEGSRKRSLGGILRPGLSYGLLLLVLALLPGELAAQAVGAAAKGKSPQPEVRIPVGAMGYMPPGAMPAFAYDALVGLHFIDETHLLFTFNIKGLLQRDQKCSESDIQRMVRAVVLDIPSGQVEKQADWELYDFNDYLWGVGNGQFLLRRCSQFDLVGASLDPHPLIGASGTIKATQFSPDRSVVVIEEASESAGKGTTRTPKSVPSGGIHPAKKVDVEFIQLHPLAVIARSQIPVPGAVPIVAEGILEALSGAHNRWIVDIQPFHGSVRQVAEMHSFCAPALTAITNNLFVAMMCPKSDEMEYQGYNLQGSLLWRIPFTNDRFSPRFILSKNGAHFAIETLHLKHPIAALDPLTKEAVDEEIIDIYDTGTGVRIAGFRTTPVYTGGKNVDFSPDGTQMAVLHDGAIEIYTLNELAKHSQ